MPKCFPHRPAGEGSALAREEYVRLRDVETVRKAIENWRLSEQVDYWRKKAQSLERELHKEVRTARERQRQMEAFRRSQRG